MRPRSNLRSQWNSLLWCANRALKLNDAISKYAENDIEVDGRIDGENDVDMSDGEAFRSDHSIVYAKKAHFCCSQVILTCFY